MILFVNACPRHESRTERLARALLGKLGEYTELKLSELDIKPLSEEALGKRSELLKDRRFDDATFRLARQFSQADTVVIAAPYWDMSFPAILKTYIENICVMGIASEYLSDGTPHGLCRAGKLYYVTTAGGPYIRDFSYGQIKALAQNYFGIPETRLVYAENLDIIGNDAEKILGEAINALAEQL